ncbi:DUF1833 family protein [uncultured Pseudacidovorax sp.]|uniref:DUF1833 family protein n=1 Tax=uncultured Pseudacidovorax sp. TaxID=679313 RepID=UPI0025DBF472|nr:DUF1833 family protein [uncultured Pseudacidovorax sp.]
MARAKSARYNASVRSLSAVEKPLWLLEIHHALLAEPLRFVNDNVDVVSNGENYVAASFEFVPPDDQDKSTPRATMRISNLGGAVGAFFERHHGGKGTTLRALQIMRSEPDFVEDELWLDLTQIAAVTKTVSGQLSYDDVLNMPGTAYIYRPETAPGLF